MSVELENATVVARTEWENPILLRTEDNTIVELTVAQAVNLIAEISKAASDAQSIQTTKLWIHIEGGKIYPKDME